MSPCDDEAHALWVEDQEAQAALLDYRDEIDRGIWDSEDRADLGEYDWA